MKTDLDCIAIFVRVVQEGSFTSAGRSVGIGPSAVSKKIARLEQQLGISLVNRTTRKLVITEKGQQFYEACSGGLQQIAQAEQAIQESRKVPSGLLRIKVPQRFSQRFIMPHIPVFLALYPEVEIDLVVGQWGQNFMDEHIDLMVASADPSNPANINLVSRTLMHFGRITCASPAYLERHGRPADYKDLASHNCLRFTDSATMTEEWSYYEDGGRVTRVRVSGNFRTNHVDAMYHALLNGLGIAHMPSFVVADAMASSELEAVFPEVVAARRNSVSMKAYYPPARYRQPTVRAFIDFLVKSLKGQTGKS